MKMYHTRTATSGPFPYQARDVARGTSQGGHVVRAPAAEKVERPEKPKRPEKPEQAETPEARAALPAVPARGGQLIVDHQGDRTVFTSTAIPPDFLRVARKAEEGAFGIIGILAAIIILGPFARMFARRLESRHAMKATSDNSLELRQQLHELQQSMDAMSVEMERIGESQRFQSKMLLERKSGINV